MKLFLRTSDQKGFTLLELVLYIALASLVVLVASSLFLWMVRAQAKASAMRETHAAAERALVIIAQEIREAESVYDPISTFGASPGQLSLETKKYVVAGEQSGYLDFYVCGTQVCWKQEGKDPEALTPSSLLVQELLFTRVGNTVRITLDLQYDAPVARPEYDARVRLNSAAALRSPQ